MNFKSDFKEDLEEGQKGEKIIAMYLVCQGMKWVHLNNDYKYDIMMHSEKHDKEVSFEVKTDVYPKDTGNIAVEIRYKGKPSGVSHSEAEWFMYWYRDLPFNNLWMIKVADLKSLIKKNKFHIVKGGDDNQSQLVLIPRKEYKEHFRVDTIKTKKLKQ
tara:strand:+ start:3204 stop:3677 length:474 start_codon:yes stop_codon:yes gene_type:complete